jgi:hypothetical protein
MADLMGYKSLTSEALRGVVQAALARVAREGLPGSHHFYIGFRTDMAGVELGDSLRARYPSEMTIVLQHRFERLEVDARGFGVSLSFGGLQNRLYVPFSALTAFYDPSVEFGLRFDETEADQSVENAVRAMPGASAYGRGNSSRQTSEEKVARGGEVVSLDAFRKK